MTHQVYHRALVELPGPVVTSVTPSTACRTDSLIVRMQQSGLNAVTANDIAGGALQKLGGRVAALAAADLGEDA